MIYFNFLLLLSIFYYEFKIFANYPNPARAETTFVYQLFEPANVLLELYSLDGKLINRLINKKQIPGYYRSKYNLNNLAGKKLSKGIYIAKFVINNQSQTLKMQVV